MLKSYRSLAATPHLGQLFIWSMLGRLNVTALPIGISFLIAGWVGSYAEVGVVAGALTVGQAASGPLRGRAADRGSARKVLVITSLGYGSGLGALVAAALLLPPGAWPVAVLIALLTGLTAAPISQVSRTTWPLLVGTDQRDSLYTLEATGQDVVSTVGPLLASLVVALLNPAWSVIMCAVLTIAGSVAFAAALRRAGFGGQPLARRADSEHRPKRRSLLAEPRFLRVVLIGLGVMASIFSVNLSVVAWTRDAHLAAVSGVLIAAWTIGSVVGGLAVGAMTVKPGRAPRLVALAVGMALLALLLPPVRVAVSPWLVGVVLFLGGTAIAPTLAMNNAQVAEVAPEDRRTEAFGWLAAASTGGAALSMPLTGALVDAAGPALSVGAGAVLATCALVLALIRQPHGPARIRPPMSQQEAQRR
jgi:MFS family permease